MKDFIRVMGEYINSNDNHIAEGFYYLLCDIIYR